MTAVTVECDENRREISGDWRTLSAAQSEVNHVGCYSAPFGSRSGRLSREREKGRIPVISLQRFKKRVTLPALIGPPAKSALRFEGN